MKAAWLSDIGKFEIRQVPDPEIRRDTDVLIRIKMVGVCGSDVHYYTNGRIGSQIVQFPFIIGHETAGIVQRAGKKVTRVKAGQKIAIDPAVSCGQCDQCLAGRENTCRKLLFLGCPGQLSGALCEYIIMPENCCYPIDEDMTFEQAILSEPLAIAVYAVERSRLPAGASAAILGIGPIGMSVFHVLRTKKSGHVFVSDKIPARLELARRLNPSWCGNPDQTDVVQDIAAAEPLLLDVVYECSGDPKAFDQAIRILKPGGTLTLVGIPEIDEFLLPVHELRRKEITLINIRRQAHCTQKALNLLQTRQVDMDAMATHHFPLQQTQDAFELVANYRDGVMKAMIDI
jgi:L-iditol 2-dehydrogenase